MKATHLLLIIPLLFYFGAAIVLDPGRLETAYPDIDLTGYLAAVSLAKDRDLAYTREDSDRYLREYGQRPAPFRVIQKKQLRSSGQYSSYYAFYYPEILVFALTPFVAGFGFRGWLLFHVLLIALIYIVGRLYYRGADTKALSPSINSVVYFTLIPVPALFLLPGHYLFLLATIVAFLFFGWRGRPVFSAIFLGLATSSQPWAALFLLLVLGYWQSAKERPAPNLIARFLIFTALSLFAVWGVERLMYPAGSVSEMRLVTAGNHESLSEIWEQLPKAADHHWSAPVPQRIIDFLFGRNSGFIPYAFAAAALLLSALWQLRDSLVRNTWLFIVLYILLISAIPGSSWNAQSFAHDFWILLAAVPFFLLPLIRPRVFFICVAVLSAMFAGPLLINPLGAITNRAEYSFSFPYKFLPVEISLTGQAGITKDPDHQLQYSGGRIYFLNDNFYKEGNYFWVRGESSLEFLLEVENLKDMKMEIRNGVLENKITLKFRNSEEVIRLGTAESKIVDLTRHLKQMTLLEGRGYARGVIRTNAGYVPGLLSRDNPDYRFLSCQIRF